MMVRIAVLQMVSTPEVDRNLDDAAALLAQAARAGAQVAAFPEYFCLIGHRDDDKLRHAEDPGSGPVQDFLAAQARQHGLWIIGGTVPIRSSQEQRVFNRCGVYSPHGTLQAHYDKMHLFRFDNGHERYDEARVLLQGEQSCATILGTDPPLRLGLSVCYDLRFPELYRAMSFEQGQRPCDLIAVPSAFTHTTGQAHWEVLLRARAIENQCYVMAPAQGGLHENGRRTFGNSLIIDPWGEVLARVVEGPGVAVAHVDVQRLQSVRSQLPALEHRRLSAGQTSSAAQEPTSMAASG